MIAKMRKGCGFRGALAYDLQSEKGHVIDSNMEGKTVRELAAEFGQIRQLRPTLGTHDAFGPARHHEVRFHFQIVQRPQYAERVGNAASARYTHHQSHMGPG